MIYYALFLFLHPMVTSLCVKQNGFVYFNSACPYVSALSLGLTYFNTRIVFYIIFVYGLIWTVCDHVLFLFLLEIVEFNILPNFMELQADNCNENGLTFNQWLSECYSLLKRQQFLVFSTIIWFFYTQDYVWTLCLAFYILHCIMCVKLLWLWIVLVGTYYGFLGWGLFYY